MSMAATTREVYVLDASVVLAWFAEAERCPQARFIRQRHILGRCRLILPDLALMETVIILRARPFFTEADVKAALTQLENLQLEIHSLSWDLARKAVAIAEAYGIGLTCALPVALAESLGCPLLTIDGTLVETFKGHSMIVNLAEQELRASIVIMGGELSPWDGRRRD